VVEDDRRVSIAQRAKNSPIMVSLTLMTVVIGSFTAIGNFTGTWDRGHTTEVELTQALSTFDQEHPHPVNQQQLAEIRTESQCQAIDIRISLAEQAIWQMEQAGQNSQRLVEKRRELAQLEAKRMALRCGAL
jgi:hypothetical protein